VLAGLAGVLAGWVGAVVAAGIGLFGIVAWRPVLATYVYLATLPFIAGVPRGTVVPFMRPNEALLVLLLGGAVAGGYVQAVRGAPRQLRLRRLDIPLAAFFLLAAVWPVASMLLRGLAPLSSDLTGALQPCKLAALVLLVRATVRTPRQVLLCMQVIIGGAAGVAVIAVLQALSIGPVNEVLSTWYPAWPEQLDRGTTTLANPIATGDYFLIGLALLVTAAVRGLIGKWTFVAAGLILTAGILAASQFSTLFGALVVCVLLVWRYPQLRASALRFAPILVVAVAVSAPILLGRRLNGLLSGEGFPPRSWNVRWDNLSYLYFPDLFGRNGFLIGVSPNSVKVPPDVWREEVWLESGYLQLLWTGGVPLLVAFVVLSCVLLKCAGRLGSRTDSVGACASGLYIAWWMVAVLSVFDAHLFMRGPGDVLFILLGVIANWAPEERAADVTS
jgi:hypothetical protein